MAMSWTQRSILLPVGLLVAAAGCFNNVSRRVETCLRGRVVGATGRLADEITVKTGPPTDIRRPEGWAAPETCLGAEKPARGGGALGPRLACRGGPFGPRDWSAAFV